MNGIGTSAIFGPSRSQSIFETGSVGKRSSAAVREGYWLDQKRGRTSGIWQVAWYDPEMKTVRYRTTGTRDVGEAQTFLDAYVAGQPVRPSTLAPTRPPTLCYFIGGDVGGIKIGASTAPAERLGAFQLQSPIRLELLAVCDGGLKAEREYHLRFAAHRLHGEWFERHPDILAEIERLAA